MLRGRGQWQWWYWQRSRQLSFLFSRLCCDDNKNNDIKTFFLHVSYNCYDVLMSYNFDFWFWSPKLLLKILNPYKHQLLEWQVEFEALHFIFSSEVSNTKHMFTWNDCWNWSYIIIICQKYNFLLSVLNQDIDQLFTVRLTLLLETEQQHPSYWSEVEAMHADKRFPQISSNSRCYNDKEFPQICWHLHQHAESVGQDY